ncbi:hypothetical protein [Vibrio parahaemolyticus]
MENLIRVLKRLAQQYPLGDYFDWEIPADCPLVFPDTISSQYAKNIYLKHHFKDKAPESDSLISKYWIIQSWGGIRSFKSNERNDSLLIKLDSELKACKLTRPTFSVISSISKVASFMNYNEYAIYDSRVIYSLNWLLFKHTNETSLYPQPSGRNAELAKFDLTTIFNLSHKNVSMKSHKTAYFEYCSLMKALAKEVYGQPEPYHVEMLLFLIATKYIVFDISDSIILTLEKT